MEDLITAKRIPLDETKPPDLSITMTEILENEDCRILAVKMWDGAVLKRHHANVPITVLCLSGSGIFKAGSDLEEQRLLQPGVLLSLPAFIEHEVAPTPELVIVVTKYKQELPTATTSGEEQ